MENIIETLNRGLVKKYKINEDNDNEDNGGDNTMSENSNGDYDEIKKELNAIEEKINLLSENVEAALKVILSGEQNIKEEVYAGEEVLRNPTKENADAFEHAKSSRLSSIDWKKQ